LAYATLEAIAFQVKAVVDAMAEDAGKSIAELRVDGGAAANDTMMQIQSDLLGCPVIRPMETESTALGAALLAGLGTGIWSGLEELKELAEIDQTFAPADGEFTLLRQQWNKGINSTKGWIEAGADE
ncbi:MAG: FGGY-family carbohydrate kinase, partial [Schleiferiaceae bacterium]